MEEDEFPFIPLELPKSHLLEGEMQVYRVVDMAGKIVSVQAASAHEAIEKSGISKPLKVVSGVSEKNKLLKKHVLVPEGKSVQTDIDLENNVSDLSFLVLDEIEETPAEPFEAFNLKQMAALFHPPAPPPAPEPEALSDAQVPYTNGFHGTEPASLPVEQQETEPLVKDFIREEPEPLELSPELEAMTKKELSEDEIKKLLGE